MRLTTWTTLTLAIVGEDLHAAVVTRGPRGAHTARGPVLRDFLSMPGDEARRALTSMLIGAGAPSTTRVILTVPSAWCAVRPVPVDASAWPNAREGLLASIEQLAPVTAADAMVGVISRRRIDPSGDQPAPDSGADAQGASGWLLVARRSQIGAWTQAVSRAVGRDVSAVLGAPMAMLGLGLQNADLAEVLDELAGGVVVRHMLVGGEVDEVALPLGFADSANAGSPRLPGVTPDAGGIEISGHDLAVAAALAEDIGAGQFVPIDGVTRPAPRRWIWPVAACLVAAGLAVGAARITESRYERAVAEINTRREEVSQQLREVERVRSRTLRLAAMIDQGVAPITASWKPTLPLLSSAQSAVSEEGFIYWIRLSAPDGTAPGAVEMRGEAKQTRQVLDALESTSSLFTNAKLVDPVSAVPQRGLEAFTVRADRKPPPMQKRDDPSQAVRP